jgi:hypothetical protein
MNKPLGGRGKKAPYETTHLRIPVPIKADIEKLIDNYRLSVIDGIESEDNGLMSVEDAKLLTRKLIKAKTSKIDTLVKLLTSIYGVEITKDELES